MKKSRQTFLAIREHFVCTEALEDYLGRSHSYVSQCLNGKKEFSRAEKIAISAAIGQPWEVIACT